MPQGFSPQLIILAVLFGLMYFMTIRPQKKKMEEEKKQREKLKVNDKVVTIGGIRGRVLEITDDSFIIETGKNGTQIEFLKQSLSYIVTPVAGEDHLHSVDETNDSDEIIIADDTNDYVTDDSSIVFVDEDEDDDQEIV